MRIRRTHPRILTGISHTGEKSTGKTFVITSFDKASLSKRSALIITPSSTPRHTHTRPRSRRPHYRHAPDRPHVLRWIRRPLSPRRGLSVALCLENLLRLKWRVRGLLTGRRRHLWRADIVTAVRGGGAGGVVVVGVEGGVVA